MNLVIVESPTKARTISQFLGKGYKVESSYGHIRDLPKSKLGIDVENNFEPSYIIPVKARKKVNELKKAAEKADAIILATDEDREGEAIAWHLTQALNLETLNIEHETKDKKRVSSSKFHAPRVARIVFHEITKSAIQDALKNPRGIDMSLVNAQQGRRILDRLVGYKLSPFLWEKVMKRLSAGRVQSVALRLIAEREKEIRDFKPEEYWSIEALLQSRGTTRTRFAGASARRVKTRNDAENQFTALLYKINNEAISKLGIKTKEETEKIVDDLEKCGYQILKIEKKKIRRNPLPPFTTSTLQQTASQRLRFSAKQTMRLAQNLYENGLITYMRTDSLNLSRQSVFEAKNWIEKEFGKKYTTQAPRFFKTKSRLAQEAHEAIRPTNPDLTPEKFPQAKPRSELRSAIGEKKLYDLIWRRFIASQMPQAIFDSTRIEIIAQSSLNPKPYTLIANGSVLIFDGFLKIWPTKFEENELPPLKENEKLNLIKINPLQHFTEPPPRYNEATLIKTLENYGIGRPSTYAPIISVIQERNYVYKNEQRRFQPTEIGEAVNKILVEHFPKIVDVQFTAQMETKFDEVAGGKEMWQKVIGDFYQPFAENLEKKYLEVEKQKPIEEKTDEICEKCSKSMVVRFSRFGKFLACSGFPNCRNTKSLSNGGVAGKSLGPCPKCQTGKVIMKRTKKRRFFYGCSRYPDCDFASWKNPFEDKPR